MSTIQELFQKGQSLLQEFPQPFLEAKLLILKCASIREEQFFFHPNKELSRKEARRFFKLISMRQAGFPLAYLTGIKEFWSIPFRVSPGVFIPRPETELIVEKVVELSTGMEETIVDIGTGCGNIAVSLAKELSLAEIIATDTSQKALKIARSNASIQQVSNISFIRGNLFSPLKRLDIERRCDFIVSNPPYVSEEEWEKLGDKIKNHEPKSALVAGETGLEFIHKMVQGSPCFLKPGGYLIIEIGEGQEDNVLPLFGPRWNEPKSFNDLSGIPRVVIGRKL